MTKAELKKINKAFKKLEKASIKFTQAIATFKETYDPNTVGLDEWCEDINDVLFDIDSELSYDEDA
jgi:hypothetical protein